MAWMQAAGAPSIHACEHSRAMVVEGPPWESRVHIVGRATVYAHDPWPLAQRSPHADAEAQRHPQHVVTPDGKGAGDNKTPDLQVEHVLCRTKLQCKGTR